MNKKISTFIMLLLGATITSAQETNAYFKKDYETVFQLPIADIDSIVFKQDTTTYYCDDFDNPQGVTINGVRWATRNVDAPGAFTSSPCDGGMYYQWGCDTPNFLIFNFYWNSDFAKADYWMYDPSPAGWRLPTVDEIKTLFDYSKVSNEWITVNGVNGRKFTDMATTNSIFLPAAGDRLKEVGTIDGINSKGDYWCSTFETNKNGYFIYINSINVGWGVIDLRSYGFSVRPVAK
ncbi:MAG: hypothetical protein FWD66_11240 [Paludibacter sp.]|nr:hypothetical protein [Paludibacter sp.]